MHNTERRLLWEGGYNIRDLGGLPAADGRVIQRGALVRADNLGHLTPAGLAALVDYGIGLIIDVRSAEECASWPHDYAARRARGARGTAMLHDGEYRALLNSVAHWYRVARAQHRTPPLMVLHGGPGGNVYAFERTIGPALEAFATVVDY